MHYCEVRYASEKRGCVVETVGSAAWIVVEIK